MRIASAPQMPGAHAVRDEGGPRRRCGVACAFTIFVSLLAIGAGIAGLMSPPFARNPELSALVVDRRGHLLRPFATAEGRWRLPVKVADVDPRLLAALIAYE